MARADHITHTSKKTETYSDLPMNFDKSPITSTLSRVTNERSVIASIKNLVQTAYTERPYQPKLGGSLRSVLFDPVTNFTADAIKSLIEDTLNNSEPRAFCSVSVAENAGQDGYDCSISYSLINNPGVTLQFPFFLSRIR